MMLRALGAISPVLVVLAGALPAGAAVWLGASAKFALWDAPQIRMEAAAAAEAGCAARITLAAGLAEQEERARQKQISNDALAAYRTALANSERAAALALERLDKETSSYEAQLVEQGRFCSITQPDIDFMFGRLPPGGTGGR